ncbi:DNA cytosine methyltransferase [Mycobacterium sp. E787]|uniref:DNA cytosine methyltransferase n=1 Tax=Mycobacterium sp. E787 TaxID=1834150 RepID=UPI0007FD22E0|nr:DNA cytosine methyltransferase [Mycobacterium sp. E787]OBI56754.1 DNA (cytosine-5-)-methyltransferase [Mycobacterium sp. E787]
MLAKHAERPLVVDLFAGAGGLSLGLEQAGYDIAAAVELDPVHAAVHEYNFPYSSTFCRDVGTVTAQEIRSKSALDCSELHAVVGGAPCQGFSLIGKRALDDPRNQLVMEFARLVLELQPRYFVLENVAGLTVGNHRKFLDEVVDLFDDAGYRVLTPYRVLQAAEFGVPQSRRRLFLIGARSDVDLPSYPTPTHTAGSMRGVAQQGFLPLSPTVWDAIGDLPDADEFDELINGDSVIAKFGKPSAYAAPLRGIEREPTDFSHLRVFDEKLLTSSMRTEHTALSQTRFAKTKPGTVEPVSRFLRLHPEGISNTLRAGTSSDRGAYTSPRPIHPTLPRVITVREAARLHGYPDWFRFHMTKWHGFRQIGNSVPPPLARAVAASLLDADKVVRTVGRILDEDRDEKLLSYNAGKAERHFGIEDRVIPQRDRK